MARLYGDTDKYGDESANAIVEAFHGAIKGLVRQKLEQAGGDWDAFVFDRTYELITAEDIERIERRLLDYGYRFDWSALVSVQERPDVYKDAEGVGGDSPDFSFEHPEAPTGEPDATGCELRGVGDNVVKGETDLVGTARYVRSSAMVLKYLAAGVPPDTIVIIDDSGGTLTAPILEQFKGVICAGGTVRSHLGILTREYGIPCFMNARISGIKEGDRVKMETTARAKTTEAYQQGIEMTAKVWRLT